MANKPESARQFLNDPIFQDIRRRIEIHSELLSEIRKRLPVPLAEHCRHCVLSGEGRLVLFTDSPAWGSQLRFHSASILAALNSTGGMAIRQITIRQLSAVTPSKATKPMMPMKAPPIQAIEAIKASCKSAPGEELRQALARLGAAMESYAGKNP